MNEEEYRLSTLDRIYEELPKATIHQLNDVLQYITNPTEFELIDKYVWTKLSVKKYNELSSKYPEEFL
jgi:hypothetical protein